VTDELRRYLANPVEIILDLRLETGSYRRQIEPWQLALFEAVFATRDGRPAHRLVYDERRRGEDKTGAIAACATADLLTGPRRHTSYAVAGDADQARLLLESVQDFRDRSTGTLGQMLEGLQVGRTVVSNPSTKSELRVLSSDDRTAYGIRPRKVWFDELSLQTDERLWTAMWSAVGKRPDAQLIAVSMAGFDFASLGWRIREMARSTASYYFASREGTDPAPWLLADMIEEQRETLHPADFARFWECKWTEAKGSWITREMFDACVPAERALPWKLPREAGCVGFVDVGLVHDPTAIAVVHRDGDVCVLDALETMQGSRNEPVQLEDLEELVVELTRRYGVGRWVFEAPQAVASVQRLQQMLPATVEARYPTAESQARLFGTLYRLFAARRLVLFAHDQLRKEALSLVTRTIGGRLKVVESAAVHQDHVVALGGAAELAMWTEPKLKVPLIMPVVVPQPGSSRASAFRRAWQSGDPALLPRIVTESGLGFRGTGTGTGRR
jgi:hypothetical protein